MSITDLPAESPHWICVSSKNVPKFRLVNRLFAAVGADHLLEDVEVTVYFVRESFERLELQHEALSLGASGVYVLKRKGSHLCRASSNGQKTSGVQTHRSELVRTIHMTWIP